ncbi:MAG: hypothetical protein WCP93_01645 [Candidatus Berkelbacteria bacterium]
MAREKRIKGNSIRKISKELQISDTTIGRWVKDIKSDSLSYNKNRLKNEDEKQKYNHLFKNLKITAKNAKLFCSLLYWCEGSKYPSSNCVTFVNSDFKLVKTFFQLLKQVFEIDNNKVRIHLQIHATHNFEEVRKFWSKLLAIPEEQFYKPTITNPAQKMKRLNYKGTCTLKYFDSKILLQITGIFEEFSNKNLS